MKAVDITRNADGTYTARIYHNSFFAGTYAECVAWLRSQGEEV
jgi:hypothetical protein